MRSGVVLINWNNAPDTLDCIASLKAGTVQPDRILVWDNGSTDDSCDRILQAYPDVVLRRSPENIGFAEANNAGARLLLEQEIEAIWILNNDTVVDPLCLSALLKALQTNPDAGAVTAKIMYADMRDMIWYAGGWVRPLTLEAVHYGLDERDTGQYDHERTIGFVTGCCMLIRAKTLAEHGLFNKEFFAYCEDLDWSLRMTAVGVTARYVPTAMLYHKVSASLKKNDPSKGQLTPMQHHLSARNQLYVIRAYSRGFARFAGMTFCILQRARYAGQNLICGRMVKVLAIILGLRQGLGRLPEPLGAWR